MFRHGQFRVAVIIVVVVMFWGGMTVGYASTACKVLVVMGFQEDFFRMIQIKEGITEILEPQCEVQYTYLNGLTEPDNLTVRAQEAYELYQRFQPDGVITTNDEAQEYFVLPYLKNQAETPIIFCDIGGDPEDFGYPTPWISGILRRPPVGDAIIFARQIDPTIKTVSFISSQEPTAQALIRQVEKEKSEYKATLLAPTMVSTFDEAIGQAAQLRAHSDALFIGPIGALLMDAAGNPVPMQALVSGLADAFGKPTLTIWKIVVESGALCAVSDFGQEQGRAAAEMLLKALEGTPMQELPITQNQFGQRIVNKTVLKALHIRPTREILMGTELVETLP